MTLALAPLSYSDGMTVTFSPALTNTAPATLNVNNLGAVVIKQASGVFADAGTLIGGIPTTVMYSLYENAFILQAISPTVIAQAVGAAAYAALAEASATSATTSKNAALAAISNIQASQTRRAVRRIKQLFAKG